MPSAAGPTPAILGGWGEELARLYLESCGFAPVWHRYRRSSGEIDWVMRRDRLLIFVEVKTRRTTRCGWPEEAVTRVKLARLRRLARCFLQDNPQPGVAQYRFDVVAIQWRGEGRGCLLRHHAGVG